MLFKSKKIKLLGTFAALAASALILSGCSNGADPTPQASSVDPATMTGNVRILMEDVPDSDIVASLIPEFNKVYPNVTVSIEKLVYDQMRDKLVASFQSPSPSYDLVVIDNSWMTDFAAAGFLQPVGDRITATADYDPEDFFTSLTDITVVDNIQYGVPFYNYALGYIYNSDFVQTSDVPTTLDGLVKLSQDITTPTMAGLAMQPQTGYKIMEEWANYLYSAGGSIYDSSGKASLDTPEAQNALAKYIELYETAAPKNSLNWGFDDAFRSVSSGGSAAMVSYNWNLAALNAPGSGPFAGKFKLAPMPGGKSALGSWTWSLPTNSESPDASWAFASWITSKSVDVQRVVAGGAAIRMSTMTDPAVLADAYGADYYEAVTKILSNAAPLTEGANGDEMIQSVGEQLNSAVAGTKSVADALSAANDAIKNIQNR
jgi:multiple sugar transport system substrate-binding protein